MIACFLKFFTDAKVSTKVSLFGWAPSIVSWKDFMKEYCAPARRDDAGGLCSLVLVLQGGLSLTNSRKERTMKQTRHLATAGPNAKKSAHMMKTTTAGIDDGSGGSGGLDDNTCDSSDLRLSGASASTTF